MIHVTNNPKALIKIIGFFLGLTLTFSVWGQNATATNQVHKTLKKLDGNDTLYIYIQNLQKNQKYITTVNDAKKLLTAINDSLIKKGYIFNKIIPDSISKLRQHQWQAFYHLKLFKSRKIDSIVFISPQKIPKNLIHYLDRKYKQKKLNARSLKELNKLLSIQTKFSLENKPYINFRKGQNLVVINLKQSHPNQVAGLLGFTYDAKDKKLQLNGLLNLQLYNVLNTGENFAFKWQKLQDIQELKFDMGFQMIMGSDFSLNNTFYSKRKDTTYAGISDEINLNYNYKKQQFGINYFTQKIQELHQEPANNNFIGINYSYHSGINFRLNVKSSLDKPENYMAYFNTKYTWHIKNRFFVKTTGNIYINQTGSNLQFYNLMPDLFRKPVLTNENYLKAYSLLNNVGFSNKKTNIFLIADFIHKKSSDYLTKTYVNSGIGLSVNQKNQILTLEIIAPIFNSYNTDYQSVYINIKQAVRF